MPEATNLSIDELTKVLSAPRLKTYQLAYYQLGFSDVTGLYASLPNRQSQDLIRTRSSNTTTGKVFAGLKLELWQQLFTLERIRILRNRIAHHEPVFTRDLTEDLAVMLNLISYRSEAIGNWVKSLEEASFLISTLPVSPTSSRST